MKKKTKIVATISDLRCDVEFIESLYEKGMNVVRCNTAHQSEEATLQIIENVRKVSDEIGILIDTKGPEIRTSVEENFDVKEGDIVFIVNDLSKKQNDKTFSTSYNKFVDEIPVNSSILIDDGDLELEVIEKNANDIKCEVKNEGTIKHKKSINVPNVNFKLPTLSDRDRSYIHFAIKHDVDFIAHSFVRSKEDVNKIQEILNEHNSQVKIIAKIENQEGVNNINEILDNVYGIMVARGDLALEIPYEKIPSIQKKLINKSIEKRKPVIIATQMLHSMINNPRPTRAEVSDIANAIYSKADAIMLSGETTFGKYPIEAVSTMCKVAIETEKSRGEFHNSPLRVLSTETSAYLCKMAVKASLKLNTRAIIADTFSGRTIRNLAGYKGQKTIFAQCYSKRTVRELALSFGVSPHYMQPRERHEFISLALNYLLNNDTITEEDTIVALGGNFGRPIGASFIDIAKVKDMLSKNQDIDK